MLFPHVWGNSWITSFVVEPLAQLEILACCLRGLECCWYRNWCLPREMRLASEIHSDFPLSCSETFLRKMCKTSCCSRCSLSLWRSQGWGSGGYYLCIHLLTFAYRALTWMAWLKWLLWLSEVCSWKPDEWLGHGSHVAKLISAAICGLKFVILSTVKFLSGSLSAAFVGMLIETVKY